MKIIIIFFCFTLCLMGCDRKMRSEYHIYRNFKIYIFKDYSILYTSSDSISGCINNKANSISFNHGYFEVDDFDSSVCKIEERDTINNYVKTIVVCGSRQNGYDIYMYYYDKATGGQYLNNSIEYLGIFMSSVNVTDKEDVLEIYKSITAGGE